MENQESLQCCTQGIMSISGNGLNAHNHGINSDRACYTETLGESRLYWNWTISQP